MLEFGIEEGYFGRLIEKSHACAVDKGFWDGGKLSVQQCMMLVLTEVSEAVESDRKLRYADLKSYESCLLDGMDFKVAFETYVKDSVEDELADVCIRMFDLCGGYDLRPLVYCNEETVKQWTDIFGDDSMCECCWALCRILCDLDEDSLDDYLNETSLVMVLGCAISFVYCLCASRDMDIMKHIELKMQYNALRPMLNGKLY